MGFGPSFRFGNPFFLQPGVDELIWRTQIKDNLSLVTGKHTYKVGGEWMHTLNDQVFRGFFTGRYLFGSVIGLPALRVASRAGRVRSKHDQLLERFVCHVPGGVSCRLDDRRRAAAALSAGRGPHGTGDGRCRRVDDHQRRNLALRPGFLADSSEHHAELRLAVGRADDARDRRSDDDGVRGVPQRSDVPLRRHDPQPVEHVAAAPRRRVGREGQRARHSCARAGVCTTPVRTC